MSTGKPEGRTSVLRASAPRTSAVRASASRRPRFSRAAIGWAGALLLAATAAGGDWPDPREMRFPPLAKIRTPEITRRVLDANGLVVYLVEDHDFPLVDYRVLVHVGTMFEPQELRGLAEITGKVLRTGGTATRSGDDLDERLESLGASIEASIGSTEGSVSASFLEADAAEGLALLADVLRRPAFPQEKIDLAKVEMRTDIASRNDEPLDIAFREFRRLMYGPDSPYGWYPEYETLERITREDIVRFHRDFFHPDRMILAVSGDFATADILAEIEKVFADWPPIGHPLPPAPPVPERGPEGIYYAEKEGVTQSSVLLGLIGTVASDPDYAELQLLDQVLGGGFSGRLMNEIRTKRGLAYDVGSSPGVGWHHPGVWTAYVLTQNDSTVTALRLLQDEVARIAREPVSPEELQLAKDIVLNQLVFDLATRRAVLNRMALYEFYGYPPDFLERFQERVPLLTPADLLEVAQRRVHPQEAAVLVVGDRGRFAAPLETLGPVAPLDIRIPDPPTRFVVAPATPESRARAQEILALAAAAHGGVALERVSSVRQDGSGTLSMMGQQMSCGYNSIWVKPDRSRIEMNIAGMFKIVAVVTGASGWRQTPQGLADLAGEELADGRADQRRTMMYLLTHAPELNAQALEPREVDGVLCDAVFIEDPDVAAWVVYCDARDHLLRGMDYRGRGPMGPVEAAERFGAYREVAGVQAAHTVSVRHDGQPFLDLSIERVEFNGPIDETLFARPE